MNLVRDKIGDLVTQNMKTVAEISIGELTELIRQVVAKQLCYLEDENGWRVSTNEEDRACYLARHPNKMPSESKACLIDESGVKAYHSNCELTEEGLRRIEEGGRQIAEGKFVTFLESKRRGMVREGKARKREA